LTTGAKFGYSTGVLDPPNEVGAHSSKRGGRQHRDGDWHFEPEEVDSNHYRATTAVPGSREKLDILAERVRAGLPLWHESDRADYDEPGTDD
jgi:hypothetical protein